MEVVLPRITTPSGDKYRLAAFIYRGTGAFNRSPKHLVVLANSVNLGMLLEASRDAYDNCEMTDSDAEQEIADFYNYPSPDKKLVNPQPSLVLELGEPIPDDEAPPALKIKILHRLGEIKEETILDILSGLQTGVYKDTAFSPDILCQYPVLLTRSEKAPWPFSMN